MFLYTNLKDNTLDLLVKVYTEPSTTEIEIVRGKETVYVDYIADSMSYNTSLALQPGEYTVIARAETASGIVDRDERYLSVEGIIGTSYNYIFFLIAIVVVMIMSLFLLGKR